MNMRSPLAVNWGWDSPFSPKVNLRAWAPALGSKDQSALSYFVSSSERVLRVVTSFVPSGESARPLSRLRPIYESKL